MWDTSLLNTVHIASGKIFWKKEKMQKNNSESLYIPFNLLCLSEKQNFSPHPHDKYIFLICKLRKNYAGLINRGLHYIKRKKKKKSLKPKIWYTAPPIFLFVSLSYVLHIKYILYNLNLSQMCKVYLEETLWNFLTSTKQ